MSRFTLPLSLLVAGGLFALGWCCSLQSASGQGSDSPPTGLGYSHAELEKYEMSVGVNPLGSPARPSKFEDVRDELHYPSFYGAFLGVTSHGDSAVFWFQDTSGVIRNTVVEGANQRLYRLQKMPFKKLEVGR